MNTIVKSENSVFPKRYLFIPFVLAMFFVVFYLVYTDIKERTIKEFNNEQVMLAKTASQGISSFFDDFRANMVFMSQLKHVSIFSEEAKAVMVQFYEIHKGVIAAITRIDSKGIIQYTYPFDSAVIGQNISAQTHVKQVLSTHQPVISDVFLAVQGYLAVAIHVPVFENGILTGSLAVLIPVDKLGKKYLGEIKVRGTGNIWLLSENGNELYCPDYEHAGKPFVENTHNDFDAGTLLEEIEKPASRSTENSDMDIVVIKTKSFNRQFIAYHRAPIGNTYWTILIRNNEKDINVGLSKLRNRLIIVFLFLVATIAYYFYSVTKFRNALKDEKKRKATEKTLRESEARFRTIFNESPIGIELFNAKGELVNSNKASLQMFGVKESAELKNFNLFNCINLDDDKQEKLRKGEIVTYQSVFDFDDVRKSGGPESSRNGTAVFDYNITSLLNHDDNTVEGYLLQIQDITDRIRAEEEITMLAHSMKSVNECVSITDMNDVIVFVNESFYNTYGYTKEELIGRHLEIIRSPNNPPGLTDEILPSTIHGEWKGELLNLRKDGTEFPIYLSTTTIKDKEGNPLGLIGVASDITERKQKEEELIRAMEKAEESDRLKSAFLANMSHEIRTPMNGILGFTELLSDTHFSGEEKQEFIDIIRKSGQRMLNTVNDLIDIAKIETGQMPVIYAETDVVEQITNLYRFFQHEAEEKGIAFLLNNNVLPQFSLIKTDLAKLDSIFTNLIKNAIKYTNKGSVEIGCRMNENRFEFYVRDTGIGIPKHRQQAIFNRFEQADIGDTRAFQGSGLGLAITKAYAEMLGGKIILESEEGKGSVFYFSFPVEFGEAEAEILLKNELPTESKDAKKKLKIMIADDDDIGYYYLQTVLNELECETFRCIDGAEVVEYCRNNNDVDLILMDIRMPVMNGLEATRKIREFNTAVVIIAQTAFALLGDKEIALAAGCNDYISKPINKAELIQKIKKNVNCA